MDIIVISVLVGLAAAFVVVSILKGQLKSVRRESGAANYIASNSLQLSVSQDVFLYKRTTSTPRNTGSKK